MENKTHKKFYEMNFDELEADVKGLMKKNNIKALGAAQHYLKRCQRDEKQNNLLNEIETFLSKAEEKPEQKPEQKPEEKPEQKLEPKPEPKMTLNEAILNDFVKETINKDKFEFTASQEAEIKREEEARRKASEDKEALKKLNEKAEARLKKCQEAISIQEGEIQKIKAEQRKKLQEAIEKDLSDEEINKIRKEYENKIDKCEEEIKKFKNTIVTLKATKAGIQTDKEEIEKMKAEREAARLKEIQEQIKREKEAEGNSPTPPITPSTPEVEYEKEIEKLKNEFLELLPNTDEGKELKRKYIGYFDRTKVKYDINFAGKEMTPENKVDLDKMRNNFDKDTLDADKTKKESFMKNFDQFVTKYYGYVVPEFNKDIDKIKDEFYSMVTNEDNKKAFDEIFKVLKNEYDSTKPVPNKITDENKDRFATIKKTMEGVITDKDEAKKDAFFKKYDSFVEKYFGKEENEKKVEKDYSTKTSDVDRFPNIVLKYLQHVSENVNFDQAIKNAGNIQKINDNEAKNGKDSSEFINAMNEGIKKDNASERMVFKSQKGLRAKLIEMKMRYKQRKNLNYGIVRRIIGYKDEEKLRQENQKMTRLIMLDVASVRRGKKPKTAYVKNLIKQNKKKMAKKEKIYAEASEDDKLKFLNSMLKTVGKSSEDSFTVRYEYGDTYVDKDGKIQRVDDTDGKTFEISIDQVKETLSKQIDLVKEQKEQDIDDEELGL